MDLSKFIALLQSSTLYFARADNLGDPFEGSTTQQNVRIFDALIEMRGRGIEIPQYEGMEAEQFVAMKNNMSAGRKSFVKTAYINCWHMNNHESAAMWSLYSKSSDSICIQSRYSRLATTLPSYINAGCVKYIDYNNETIIEGNSFNFILHKRASFRHENEIRAVAWASLSDEHGGLEIKASIRNDGANIPIALNDLVENVFVNPLSPIWFRDVVEDVAKKYNLAAPIRQSDLASRPIF